MSAKTRFAKERPFAAAVGESIGSISEDFGKSGVLRSHATSIAVFNVAYALLDLSDGVRDVADAIRATKGDES